MQLRFAFARPFLVWSLILFAPPAAGAGLAAQDPVDPDSADTRQEEERGASEGLPLEPGRTIPIDLTEGTWISVDVSPDGTMLAFDYLGDLFTLPIEGGNATQITSGMAFDAQPRFSPDGTRIAFTSDRDGGQNIWVMSLDGSDTVQISKGGSNRAESPEWTPDGDYLIASMGDFRGQALPKLRIFHVDGGSGVRLIDEPEELKTIGAAVSPDGRYVWYARRNGDWTYNAPMPQYQLEVYDRDTGQRFTRSARYGSGIRPTLSPDGRWLVYGTRHETHTGLVLRDLGTGAERWLAYPVQHDDQESRATLDALPGMSFTPDSRHLIVSYGGRIWRLGIEDGGAEEIPFRVRFDLEVGPAVDFDYPIEDTPTFAVRQIRDAVPSPSGDRLAFTAMDRLWVSDSVGQNPRRVTDADISEHFPAWSPDGESLVYSTWDGEGGRLYRVDADGGTPVALTLNRGVYFYPVWAPDGRIIATRSFAQTFETIGAAGDRGSEFIWVPSDPESNGGSEARMIAPTDGRSDPHFVSGSDRIYLFRSPDLLVSMRWDGTDEKEHVKVRGRTPSGSSNALSPGTIRMAPVGDQAFALIQRQLYTVTVPRVGTTPTISVSNPDNAAFPARQVSDIGAEFPAWSGDGRKVHWSLGSAHFVYDLDAAQAYEDSVEAAEAAEADPPGGAEADSTEVAADAEEDEEDDDGYRPREFRVRIEVERDLPQGVVALRGARVITMRGDEVIENADLVIRNHRIESVGAAGSVAVPDGAREIDVTGSTIVPGFVDTHAHLRARDELHRTDVWPYLANLAYGVTTTRDPQTGNTEVLSYADQVRAGSVIGPRIYSTGPGVFWQDGIDSEEDARKTLSRYSDYFDTKTIKMYVAGARKARQWIIMAARDLELMPTTEGSLNIKQNITETIDGYPGLEHSIPIFPVYEDLVRLFAGTGRVYTPTLLVSYGGPWAENYFYSRENPHDDPKLRRFTPHDEIDGRTLRRGQWFRADQHVFERHSAFVRDLIEAGGKAGVGSHGQLQGLGYHWELWAMQAGGVDEHDALRIATLYGAEAIGLDRDLGSLEPGKLADLVVLNANPLDDIRATSDISHVMVNGRLYDGETLNEIYPRERPLPALWWWDDEPVDLPGVRTP